MSRPPFQGITVVELGSSIAAPFAARILADLGARVIKVEQPGDGDAARKWGPPLPNGDGAIFHSVNMGKLSITVDMKDPAALAALKALIREEADVVLQNLRSGAAGRLGLGAETLRAEKPSLIYCNMWAFGAKGPLADRPGYDPLMQAFTGIVSLTGEADGPPARVGVSLMDLGTGMWAAIGIVSALFRRAETGEGGAIDVSLFETGVGWLTMALSEFAANGVAPKRSGLKGPILAPNDGYETADGVLVIVVGTDVQFARFCEVLRRSDLALDPRFQTNAVRFANAAELRQEITAVLKTDVRAAWAQKLDAAAIPNAPVQTVEEVAVHPQTQALKILRPSDDNPIELAGLPLSLDGARPSAGGHAPKLGEHNDLLRAFLDAPSRAPVG